MTLTPGNAMPNTGSLNIPNSDKIGHFIIFAVFAFLLFRGFAKQNKFEVLNSYPLLFSLIISVSFGIVIEFIQNNIPGRSFDPLDILANTIGIALGLGIFYLKR
ncbi:MAG: VanZ family protein [Bacteroidota bacterium]|nr:VanZ family protein [Bacteroidota bacterium]